MAWETDNDVNFKCHLRQGNKSLNTLCRHGLVKKGVHLVHKMSDNV